MQIAKSKINLLIELLPSTNNSCSHSFKDSIRCFTNEKNLLFVDNLSFSLSNYEAQCNDLIAIATKKAKTRAEVIAQALGTSISGISNISTSCSTNNYNPPRLYMAKNMIADVAAESSSAGGVLISNGVVKVNANVNAGFFVK